MSKPETDDGLSRFQRYRRVRRDSGMKLLRVWLPDPSSDEFQSQARRQALLLRDAPEEAEALRFIEAAVHWPEP